MTAATGFPTTAEYTSFCQPIAQLQNSGGGQLRVNQGACAGRRLVDDTNRAGRGVVFRYLDPLFLDLREKTRQVAFVFIRQATILLSVIAAKSFPHLIPGRLIQILTENFD